MPRKSLITRKILITVVFLTLMVVSSWVIIYHSRKTAEVKKVELKVNNNQNQELRPFSDSKKVPVAPEQNKPDEPKKPENNQNDFPQPNENSEQNPPKIEENTPPPSLPERKEETPKVEEPKGQKEEPKIPPPPSQPNQPNEEKKLEVVNGKVQVPRR